MKLKTSTSFRALAANFLIQISIMSLNIKGPTHTTILNWVHKIGYYELMKKKEKADDWIIILDESIQIGADKILMIFGIREKNIDFSRPLILQDLVPLRELVNTSWTGEEIREVLLDIKDELGDVKYAVSDGGNNIINGLKLSKITHVYDITHKIAWIVCKLYKKNDIYISLTKRMTEMRVKYLQTKIAYLIPPKQRSKSRYLNINEIAKWCSKVLNYYDKNKDARNEICKKIEWIIEYRDFVLELNELNELVCKIEKKLKYNGFSNESLKYCNDLLEKIDSVFCKEMKTQLKIYFKDLQEKNINAEKLLITSDIIESSFGKYKNYVSQNPMAGITNLILSISAFTSTLNEEDIKEALENTNIYDVKDWTKKNIGKTLFQERKEAFVF
jgi:hypothetical protein